MHGALRSLDLVAEGHAGWAHSDGLREPGKANRCEERCLKQRTTHVQSKPHLDFTLRCELPHDAGPGARAHFDELWTLNSAGTKRSRQLRSAMQFDLFLRCANYNPRKRPVNGTFVEGQIGHTRPERAAFAPGGSERHFLSGAPFESKMAPAKGSCNQRKPDSPAPMNSPTIRRRRRGELLRVLVYRRAGPTQADHRLAAGSP